jgi:hypothetical protein
MSEISNKSLIFNYLFLILFSFFAAFIYLIYRDSSILFNQLFLPVGFQTAFDRQQIHDLLPLPNWVIYSFPGGIWVFITTIIAKKYDRTENKITRYFAFIPLIYAVGLEFLQLFHFTDGTFDWVDLLIIFVAAFAAGGSNKLELSLKNHPNFQNLALFSAFLVLFLSDVHR